MSTKCYIGTYYLVYDDQARASKVEAASSKAFHRLELDKFFVIRTYAYAVSWPGRVVAVHARYFQEELNTNRLMRSKHVPETLENQINTYY